VSRASHQPIALTFESGGVKHYQAKNTFLSSLFQRRGSSSEQRGKSNWTSDSTGKCTSLIGRFWSGLLLLWLRPS